MAKCKSCSAPLAANINLCHYCNTRNDVDLHRKHKYSVKTQQSNRICPHCETNLQTIKLDINESLHIERCKSCFGLFFDLGEIDSLLNHSVSNISDINLALIKNINKDRFATQKKVKYIKCPVCREYMRRINFGHKSGVIVDQCSHHGVWADSGEVTHLMEWKKAGGELLNAEKQHTTKKPTTYENLLEQTSINPTSKNSDQHVLETISSLVFKIFS